MIASLLLCYRLILRETALIFWQQGELSWTTGGLGGQFNPPEETLSLLRPNATTFRKQSCLIRRDCPATLKCAGERIRGGHARHSRRRVFNAANMDCAGRYGENDTHG
ncbi:hypothetical protein UP10_35680 [Bradyrhizobium sp. LTSPM299]|nr:hypothetical protein UP10_35680 [Bradyrhizobium sp. LTSPM299]